MKKIKWLSLLLLICVISTVCFACGSLKIIDEEVGEYEYYYQQEFVDKHAENVKIDGVLDEDIYQNKGWLKHGDNGLKFKYTTAFDEYGVYIGAIAYDNAIIYLGRYDLDEYVGSNSGFTFYVTTENNNDMHPMKRLKLETDAKGRRSYSQQRFEAYTVIDGELNGETTSMTTEVFFSWKALGITDEERLSTEAIPTSIKMEPLYRQLKNQGGTTYTLHTLYPTFTEPSILRSHPLFGATGYLLADNEETEVNGSTLGDAKHWLAKTDGWDMSHYGDENGYVVSTNQSPFADTIYFKDVYAENFYAQVYCKPSKTSGEYVGLIAQSSFVNFRAVYLESSQLPKFALRSLTYYPKRQWNQTYGITYSDSNYVSDDYIHFEMVKTNDTIMFFVNGELVYSDTQSWYKGNYAAGLFALNSNAEFKGYYAEELTDKEVAEKLSSLGCSAINLNYNVRSGATVSVQSALSFDEQFNFNISMPVGTFVYSFKINGIDVLEDYQSNANNGVYIPTIPFVDGKNPLINDTGDTDIEIEFDSLSYTIDNSALNYGIKEYVLTVQDKDEKPLFEADVIVSGKDNKSLYYTGKTDRNGEVRFYDLPIQGYKIGNETISGNFIITICIEGYETYSYEININKDFGDKDTPNIVSQLIKLEKNLIGGQTIVGGRKYLSSNDWSIAWQEGKQKATATLNYSRGQNLVVFNDVVSTASVIEFTVNITSPTENGLGYDLYPGFGVALLNTKLENGYAMIIVGGQVRTMKNLTWDNEHSVAHSVMNSDLFATHIIRAKDIKLRFIHEENLLKLYVYDTTLNLWRFIYEETNADFNTSCGYALFKTGGGVDAKLKDISIVYGKQAVQLIEESKGVLRNEVKINGITINASTIGGKATDWSATNEKATTQGAGREAKFFKETSTKYLVETKISGLTNNGAHAGVIISNGEETYAITLMTYNDSIVGCLLITDFSIWENTWLVGNIGEYSTDGEYQLKIENDGEKLDIYVNEVIIKTLNKTSYGKIIGNENAIGLLSISDSIEFSDFSFQTVE